MNAHPYAATPTLSVIDPRALAIRGVGYCRHPDSAGIDPRITRQRFDAAGHLIESWDPRLWGTSKPNLTTVYGLSGQPLLTDSVDGGWQLSLPDQAGSPCSFWDARGSQRHTRFDEQQRPITVTEQAAGELPCVVERFTYGDCGPAYAEHNQGGQLIRHDDPAGSQIYPEYGMAAGVLREERRFLAELETPDWPLEPEARDELLEPQSFITCHTFNPTGELRQQTDAMGNLRTFGYDLAGKPDEAWLQVAGEGKPSQRLVSAIRYNALDQVERETAGNGVVTRVEYAADDGRLLRLQAALGNQKPLQDLNYVYDPVGNIVELQDLSQPVTHFNNQRIDPINRYRYDSLYQLVEARGWEVSQPSHGPALPALLPTPLDPNQRRNYTQQFEYDRGGNLITRHHSGAPGFSMFTSALSNRSLAQHDDGSLPGEGEIASGFDAGGNQRELQRGQAMIWDLRNQLSRVTLVQRETEPDDYECYRYDRPGHRLRKMGFAQSSGRTLRSEVRYLPGLEIHRQAEGEEHHVISIEAGRSNVRALHWPAGEHGDQLRYSLGDHLGSSTLELDDEAGVLTREHYYPFGGTACWAGKSALVAKYKTLRYSGKERDATGLYYYGYRYYAPWLQRWMSPDPAGDVSGPNRYLMVKNNPIIFFDEMGLNKENAIKLWRHAFNVIVATGSAMPNFDPDLEKRYHLSSDEDKRRIGFIAFNLQHRLIGTNTIESIGGEDLFTNTYGVSEWVLKSNYKESKTRRYFASDVAKFQYVYVSRENRYFGYLPFVLKRQTVTNQDTLKTMNEAKGTAEERLGIFLEETPNGKSTKRIMNEFKLIATGFKQVPEVLTFRSENGKRVFDSADFNVYVRFSVLGSGGEAGSFVQTPRSEARAKPLQGVLSMSEAP
ncbi:UNVERIFIED_ORG: insecticidal toxin complex protein TccC [Pseudomonas reinekei]|uniref:RHS repeat domain-containing protein n=1 Tax=Pseudomonas laurylsulfatiphila TaxID=2011015 RepID=UPI003D1A974A|nr:insecticidal toxin complex protein TccC [Pseudomonas reinekei]